MSPLKSTNSEPSIISLYQHLEDQCNTRTIHEADGHSTVVIEDHWHYGRMAIIDTFVQMVLSNKEPGYSYRIGYNGRRYYHQENWIRPFYRSVTGAINFNMHEQFDIRNVFVELFVAACHNLNIFEWRPHCLSKSTTWEQANAEAFNELIEVIRHLRKQKSFTSKIWHYKNDHIRNYDECKEYIRRLFCKRSRYTVIRIDLGYTKEMGFSIFNKDAKADLEKFTEKIQNKSFPFKKAAGYVWKIEYGEDRLLHSHWYIFLKNTNGAHGGYWAQEIGKCWKKVVNTRRGCDCGIFDNRNFKWKSYSECCLNEVNKDTVKFDYLLKHVGYLFKLDQCLPIRRSDPGYRTFGKGKMPKG